MDTFYSTFSNLWKRITNLEAITQALADELMAQDDYIDDLIAEYRQVLDTLENYEQEVGR